MRRQAYLHQLLCNVRLTLVVALSIPASVSGEAGLGPSFPMRIESTLNHPTYWDLYLSGTAHTAIGEDYYYVHQAEFYSEHRPIYGMWLGSDWYPVHEDPVQLDASYARSTTPAVGAINSDALIAWTAPPYTDPSIRCVLHLRNSPTELSLAPVDLGAGQEPAIASAGDAALIAWTDGEGHVLTARVNRESWPNVPAPEVLTEVPGNHRPQLAFAPTHNTFLAVWNDASGRLSCRTLDSAGRPMSEPLVVAAAGSHYSASWNGEQFVIVFFGPFRLLAARISTAGRRVGSMQVISANVIPSANLGASRPGETLIVWAEEWGAAPLARRYDSELQPIDLEPITLSEDTLGPHSAGISKPISAAAAHGRWRIAWMYSWSWPQCGVVNSEYALMSAEVDFLEEPPETTRPNIALGWDQRLETRVTSVAGLYQTTSWYLVGGERRFITARWEDMGDHLRLLTPEPTQLGESYTCPIGGGDRQYWRGHVGPAGGHALIAMRSLYTVQSWPSLTECGHSLQVYGGEGRVAWIPLPKSPECHIPRTVVAANRHRIVHFFKDWNTPALRWGATRHDGSGLGEGAWEPEIDVEALLGAACNRNGTSLVVFSSPDAGSMHALRIDMDLTVAPLLTDLGAGLGDGAFHLVSNGTDFLALWSPKGELRAMRVDASGDVLDAGGFTVSSGSGTVGSFHAAWDGAHYIVGWAHYEDERGRVHVRRVADDGSLPDPVPFIDDTDAASYGNVSVASTGGGRSLIVANSGRGTVRGRFYQNPIPVAVEHQALSTHGANSSHSKATPEILSLVVLPNPIRERASFAFTLTRETVVSLAIYDVEGRLVRQLLSASPLPPSLHRVEWDVGDAGNGMAPSGIYYFRLDTASESRRGKLLVLR